MFSKRGKFILKCGITILLITYLVLKSDWYQFKVTISAIKIFPFVISCVVAFLSTIPMAIQLQILLKPTGLQFSLSRLIKIQLMSQFYSLLLPSGVGVSLARWYKITQNKYGRKVFIVVTIVEKTMLTMIFLLCTGVPLLFARDSAIQSFRLSALPIIFLLIFVCFFIFCILLQPWVYGKFALIMGWVQHRFSTGLFSRIIGIYEDCGLYIGKKHLLFKAFIFQLFYQILLFSALYLVFVALRVDLPPITILWISMLVWLLLSVPISIGGIGVRETGFAWLLTLYGIAPETGILLGGLLSIHFFLSAVLGAILNMLEKRHSI